MSVPPRPGHRAREAQVLAIPPGLCRRCVRALSRRLRDLPGMVSFEVDAAEGRLFVSGDVDPAAAQAAIEDVSCS
jgi:Heavy-metal-associated domain